MKKFYLLLFSSMILFSCNKDELITNSDLQENQKVSQAEREEFEKIMLANGYVKVSKEDSENFDHSKFENFTEIEDVRNRFKNSTKASITHIDDIDDRAGQSQEGLKRHIFNYRLPGNSYVQVIFSYRYEGCRGYSPSSHIAGETGNVIWSERSVGVCEENCSSSIPWHVMGTLEKGASFYDLDFFESTVDVYHSGRDTEMCN